MYQLTITKSEDDPDYPKKLKQYEERNRLGYGPRSIEDQFSPKPTREVKVLETTVTDEEFAVIKKAALEVM